MLRRIFRQMVQTILVVAIPSVAFAMPAVSVSFAGNGSFVLSGSSLEAVGKIVATVTFDATRLANTRLIPRSTFPGASVTMDDGSPGVLKLEIASDSPMNGNGAFGVLTFDQIGTSPGAIGSFTGAVFNTSGKPLSAIFDVTNPTPQLDPSDPEDAAMIQEREKRGQSFMGGDVAYLSEEAAAVVDRREQERKEESAATGADDVPGAPSEEESEVPAAPVRSVVERFRLFEGKRTPENLVALFQPDPGVSLRQEPEIGIADGKGSVRVFIEKIPRGKRPNFLISSGRYLSCAKISQTEWVVEVRPKQGVTSAMITVLDGGAPREVPVTVAPEADVDLTEPGKVTEADFTRFLAERGTLEVPLHDLNGDGKRDYLDDYVFTANYLAAAEKLSQNEPARQQKPETETDKADTF